MKYLKPMLGPALALLALIMPVAVLAADSNVPVYNPPKRGAPAGRVGGGTRGGRDVFVLSVLAPDHSGFTTSEQPTLYWSYFQRNYAADRTYPDGSGVESQPILETRLATPIKGGIQRVRLADYNIRLAPGAAYRWFVVVAPDADRRSKDILAGGAIERA